MRTGPARFIGMNVFEWLLYKWSGWTKDVTVEHPDKCVICLAPHTSNRDFIIGQMYIRAERLKIRFLMKEEWFFWPFGALLRRMGGIAIFRSATLGVTDSMAEAASRACEFRLCVTPEGTRSLNPDWKSGFYYIALKAGIPILLYGLDYQRRLIKCTKSIMPTGDFDTDMREIRDYYRDFSGMHPDRFSTGE